MLLLIDDAFFLLKIEGVTTLRFFMCLMFDVVMLGTTDL